MILIILVLAAFWGAGLLYQAIPVLVTSHSSCTPATRRLPPDTSVVRTKAGECTGISDGAAVFDINQPGRSDSTLKQQAAALARGDRKNAEALFQQAVEQDKSDAEAYIYLEDLRVLTSGRHFITFIIGTKISGDRIDLTGERRILQGAYIAQQTYNQTCRDQCMLVRLLIANTGNDANNAKEVAKQIVQVAHNDKTIMAVDGWSVSQDTFNMVSTLQSAQIPMVSGTASSTFLTDVSPYFFRVAPPDSSQGALAATYATSYLHARRIALFADLSNVYSSSLAGAFKQALTGNITVVLQSYTVGMYAKDKKRVHDDLQEIATSQPDLIYFAGYSDDARTLFEELSREKQFADLPIMGGDDLYNLVGGPDQHVPGLDRLLFTAFASPDEWRFFYLSKNEPSFFQEYRTFDHNTPTGDAILAYDALQVLLKAVQTASVNRKGPLTGYDIQQALQNIKGSHALQGLSGRIAFGDNGNPQDKTVLMLSVNQYEKTQILLSSGTFLQK
jgi:ABC-type branched-subunit amino acid transport system substrate-binding protein